MSSFLTQDSSFLNSPYNSVFQFSFLLSSKTVLPPGVRFLHEDHLPRLFSYLYFRLTLSRHLFSPIPLLLECLSDEKVSFSFLSLTGSNLNLYHKQTSTLRKVLKGSSESKTDVLFSHSRVFDGTFSSFSEGQVSDGFGDWFTYQSQPGFQSD